MPRRKHVLKKLAGVCEHCGKTFPYTPSKTKPVRKFCGLACYHARKGAEKRVERKCLQCGETFHPYRTHAEQGRGLTCSTVCRRRFFRRGLPPEALDRICETCGKTFRVRPLEHLTGKARRHCSNECRKRRGLIVCETCGVEFEAKLTSGGIPRRFCSRHCYHSRRTATRPEVFVRAVLEEAGLEFRAEEPLGSLFLDFFVPALSLGIEVDGTYWHSRENSRERDYAKEEAVRRVGIRLLRISEENTQAPDAEKRVLRSILRALLEPSALSQMLRSAS